MGIQVLQDHLLQKLGSIARSNRPNEVVGLILPDDRILALPNRSLHPSDSFAVTGADIRIACELNGVNIQSNDWESTTLWHSHPAGGVGPSRIDMQHKMPDVNHLVISLSEKGEVIPAWY